MKCKMKFAVPERRIPSLGLVHYMCFSRLPHSRKFLVYSPALTGPYGLF
jgi:hypothetical protein